jgi:glycolate oxidase iron-sulfur subunit
MQTKFTTNQLQNPAISEANNILRSCVHCGFCTATCPTYVLLGDENDSPRGRIYLIKEMLEKGEPASAQVTKHIDRCLSCLSCMSTCPSGVHYMHLVDQARVHIEKTYRRPWMQRALRGLLAAILPHPGRFRLAAKLGRPFKVFSVVLNAFKPTRSFGAMLQLLPKGKLGTPQTKRQVYYASGGREPKARVILHLGCAQQVLRPEINEATIRLLNRLDVEVIVPENTECCGALVHHMGREASALSQARKNIDVWLAETNRYEVDAILSNASGCGVVVKDYGYMLRLDKKYADSAAQVSGLVKDISEYLTTLDMPKGELKEQIKIAYQSACSLQHGQQIKTTPANLLTQAGFTVKAIPEGHLCCGSAGTYNILHSGIADRLLERKLTAIETVQPDVVAAGNIGCMTQIARKSAVPVLHTVELLDWATGGPVPPQLQAHGGTAPPA